MLLRRMMEHVKNQNWTAVALDFFIVVFGVFIGIEASNWNASQAERRVAQTLTVQLIEDLRQDIGATEVALSYFGTVRDAAYTAMDGVDDPAFDPEEFIISAYTATQYMILPSHKSTYDELLATGRLGSVGDPAFRNVLVLYYRDDYMRLIGEYVRDSQYRERLRRRMPHTVQHAVRAACGDIRRDTDGYIMGLAADCDIDLSENELRDAADLIRTESELVSDLQFYISTLDALIADVEGMRRRLTGLVEAAEEFID